MNEGDLLREALKVGPLVAGLGLVVWVLWKKLEAKDVAMSLLTREVVQTIQANTTAMTANAAAVEHLREAIEGGGARGARRSAGAD